MFQGQVFIIMCPYNSKWEQWPTNYSGIYSTLKKEIKKLKATTKKPTPRKLKGWFQPEFSSAPSLQSQLCPNRFEHMAWNGASQHYGGLANGLFLHHSGCSGQSKGCDEGQLSPEQPPFRDHALDSLFSPAMVGSRRRNKEHQLILLIHFWFLCNYHLLEYSSWPNFRGGGIEKSGWRDLKAKALLEQSPVPPPQ